MVGGGCYDRVKVKVVKDGKNFPLPVPFFQLEQTCCWTLLHQGHRPVGSQPGLWPSLF